MLIETLQETLFHSIDRERLKPIADLFQTRFYREQEVIFNINDEVTKLYLVHAGFLAVTILEGDREVNVGQITQGEIFGEMSFATESRASAKVAAVSNVVLYEIDKTILKDCIESNHELKLSFYESLAKTMSTRLRLTSANYAVNDYLLGIIREKNKELKTLNDRLTELLKQKDYFLGIAAHDIRNPLATASLYLQFINSGETGPVSERVKKVIAKLNDEIFSLVALLNDLLDVSQIESGTITLHKTMQPIKELFHEVYHFNRVSASKKNIKFEYDDQCPEDLILPLDRVKISSVLNNIYSNAIKFSNPNTTVVTRLYSDENDLVIEISDEGPGIKDEDRAKLFQPFSRAANKPTGGESSTGLGLSISKKFVEAHGGTIELKSRVGQGSKFSIRLPKSSNPNSC
jgi:signal transduction histidine kinase